MDFLPIAIGLAAVFGLLAAAIFVQRIRRAGLGLHHQLDTLKADVFTLQQQHAAAASDASGRFTTVQGEVRALQRDVSTLTPLPEALRDLSLQVKSLSNTTALLARTPPPNSLIDSRLLEAVDDSAIAATAESIAVLRPLAPYPRWQTNADWNNPDLAYQLRRCLWKLCNDRRKEIPILLPWHYATRLRLFLGNDVTSQIYVAGCLEPNEFAFLDRILEPGMTFIDVGANEGIYSVFAAKRVGPRGTVWCFEPSRREIERLQHNLELNGIRAEVFHAALADSNGDADLIIAEDVHAGHNTLGAFAYSGMEVLRTEKVPMRSLDSLTAQMTPARIDLIKIDVEGSEIRALRGARQTIQRYRPTILFEVSETSLREQGGSREELIDLLRSYHYRIYAFDPATGLPVSAAPGWFTDNMLGVPEGVTLDAHVYEPWPQRPESER